MYTFFLLQGIFFNAVYINSENKEFNFTIHKEDVEKFALEHREIEQEYLWKEYEEVEA